MKNALYISLAYLIIRLAWWWVPKQIDDQEMRLERTKHFIEVECFLKAWLTHGPFCSVCVHSFMWYEYFSSITCSPVLCSISTQEDSGLSDHGLKSLKLWKNYKLSSLNQYLWVFINDHICSLVSIKIISSHKIIYSIRQPTEE